MATIKLLEQNMATLVKWQWKYRFMFVSQCINLEELQKGIDYINQYADSLRLSIGISKLSPIDRGCEEAQAMYLTAKFPIHFLGIKTTFKELIPVKNIIRSCDTSQLSYIAKNELIVEDLNITSYERDIKVNKDIDLEKDNCDSSKLLIVYEKQQMELADYGIL